VTEPSDTVASDVRQYLEKNPDADAIDVISDFVAPPSERELVEDLVAERRDDPADEGDETPPATCALPRCDEPRRNDHAHSLCEEHGHNPAGAGEISQPEPRDGSNIRWVSSGPDDENSEGASSASACNREGPTEDLAAEAAAVAGAEPDRSERDTPCTPDPDEQPMDVAGVAADDDDQEDAGVDEGGRVSAAALMGGSDSEFAADPSEEYDQQRDRSPDSTGTTLVKGRSMVPLAQLDALAHDERRRLARKRGLDWPSTDDARDELDRTVKEVMRNGDTRVIDAPTALGKSHEIAATRWGVFDDVTGGQQVVMLAETRDARDEAVETATEHGGEFFLLESRDEACPVAGGRHDPDVVKQVDEDRQAITMDGEAASEWIQEMCGPGSGMPFSDVHRRLENHNDQNVSLPCCAGTEQCDAIAQWEELREGDHPLVIATHQFAHVPSLRSNKNIVFDEAVDFIEDFGFDKAEPMSGRIKSAVAAFLEDADAPLTSWEEFIMLATGNYSEPDHTKRGGLNRSEYRESLKDEMQLALDHQPDREWFYQDHRSHTLAPALARAIFNAEPEANGRRRGKTPYQPPRLDDEARDDDSWNQEWISVVLDDDHSIRTVRSVPDFALSRSVIGLDAHPALPVWQANIADYIQKRNVLEPQERHLWRRFERGLRVVQVGDATRPLTKGEYFNDKSFRAIVEHLREQYGDQFSTMLTAGSVESRCKQIMRNVGISNPETLHFGEEKSNNSMAGEPAGLVEGCIDPGDGYVLDLLAELELDARPVIVDCGHCDGRGECSGDHEDDCDHVKCSPEDDECGLCKGSGEQREKGRTFEGPDADLAAEILASVRENHTAQAAGRYARNADDPDDAATVYIRTDAVPPGFADVKVPGVDWTFAPRQADVVEALRDQRGPVSALDLSETADVSKEHVRDTLERLREHGYVDATPGAGNHGATLYADRGVPHAGVVGFDRGAMLSPTPSYGTTRTWLLAIRDPTAPFDDPPSSASASGPPDQSLTDWSVGSDGGG